MGNLDFHDATKLRDLPRPRGRRADAEAPRAPRRLRHDGGDPIGAVGTPCNSLAEEERFELPDDLRHRRFSKAWLHLGNEASCERCREVARTLRLRAGRHRAARRRWRTSDAVQRGSRGAPRRREGGDVKRKARTWTERVSYTTDTRRFTAIHSMAGDVKRVTIVSEPLVRSPRAARRKKT